MTETTHSAPAPGLGLTGCCASPPFDLPRGDRMTLDATAVTCTPTPERVTLTDAEREARRAQVADRKRRLVAAMCPCRFDPRIKHGSTDACSIVGVMVGDLLVSGVIDEIVAEESAAREAEVRAQVKAFADSRGVNVGDEDDEYWRGCRQAQRECLRDAAALDARIAGGDQ